MTAQPEVSIRIRPTPLAPTGPIAAIGASTALAPFAFVVALTVLAVGCASAPHSLSMEETVLAAAHEKGVDGPALILPFALSDEMRHWARQSVPTQGSTDERLDGLLAALLDSQRLNLSYDAATTGTAVEVFATHQANCLSFTHLFVGIARELGLPVYYLRVVDIQTFAREGDLIVVSGHVTAAIGSGDTLRVLEFTERPVREYRRAERISDLEAVALFYSNRGAELVRAGDQRAALEWLETASRLAPNLGEIWVNMGVARRRSGRATEAEAAYRRALEEDPEQVPAYQNLAALLTLTGRGEEATELLALTDRATNRNPFSYLALGDLARERGRLAEAERFYRRALRLDPKQAEPHAAMGEWAVAAGRPHEARRWLRKAVKIDPQEARTVRLKLLLGAAKGGSTAAQPQERGVG